jgi:hypothetical protein
MRYERRVLPAFDDDAQLLVDGEAERATHGGHPARLEPAGGVVEEAGGDVGVVDAFEETEEAGVLLVRVVMEVVDLGGDASDRLAVLFGQEEGDVGVLEEGIFLRVQEFLPFHEERRDPGRVVL